MHVGDGAATSTAIRSRIVGQRPSRRRLPRARCRSSRRRGRGGLSLNANQIGDEGAVAWAEAVGKGRAAGTRPRRQPRNSASIGNKLSQTAKDAWEAVKAKEERVASGRVTEPCSEEALSR